MPFIVPAASATTGFVERLTFDPHAEDTANAPLELISAEDDPIFGLVSHAYPAPQPEMQYTSSVDTDGERPASRRYRNRQINLALEVTGGQQPASTNLYTNPKAAVDTTGVVSSGLASFARVSSLPVRFDRADTAFHGVGNSDDDAISFSLAVSNGVTYRFSMYVLLSSLSATGVRLEVWSATPALVASSSDLATLGAWARLDVSVTANATATWTFRVAQDGAGAADFYATCGMIETSGTLTPYIDGDSPGCDWSGTPNASTSTRPASSTRMQAALADLQAKVAKIVAEGGTLRRTLPNGDTRTYDLVTYSGYEPTFDIAYYAGLASVTIGLEALPFGRGALEVLGSHVATSKQPLVWTETGLKGDVYTSGVLTITNVTNAKSLLVWGLQSREYDSASAAALFLEAEGCVASSAVLDPGPTGASGGGTNKVFKHSTVGTGGSTAFLLGTGGVANVQHVGTYAVLVRAQAPSANTGIAKSRIEWAPSINAGGITNDWVPIQTAAGVAIKGSWVVLNLGLVRLPKAESGVQRWAAAIESASTVGADTIHYDWVGLVPVDEGSGLMLTGTDTAIGPAGFTSPLVASTGFVEITDHGVRVGDAGDAWATPRVYEGDYFRTPPAGREGRTTRVFVLLTGPSSSGGNLSAELADAVNIDAITARLSYAPLYL